MSTNRRMRYRDDMDGMFDRLTDLTVQQRDTIKERYRFLMAEYRRRLLMYALLFYVLRITMTVGSLTVPALLSLNVSPNDQTLLKWLTWAISLAVTTANGLITLFKVDKRFFMLHSVAERLRTEAWQFLALAGRYSGHYGGHRPTHANQYVYFTSQMEKIRMKHIEEEFIRQADMGDAQKSHAATNGTTTTTSSSAPSSTNVPSPPDTTSPAAAALRRRESVLSPPQHPRRESESTVGSGDDHIVHIPSSTEMSVPGREQQAVPPALQIREPLLLQTSELSDVASERSGASVQSGTVQQRPDGPGDA